jgi:NitT/TauT family transport system substrate-binding protein
MGLDRRLFTVAAALGAACGAVPSLRAEARPEKTRLTIAVSGKAALSHLPLTIAEQLGYFKAEGLDVDVADYASATLALQAAASGTADVVSGAFENTIALQNRGQMFQAFVLQARAPQIAIGVSTRNMPYYSAVADLRGRRIGISAPGSSTDMAASLVLSRAGLKASDVSFVGVGAAAGALASLRSGQIDAMSNTDPVMTMLEQKGEVRIICDTRTLRDTLDVFGGPMPATCLYAPLEFVQRHPRSCQALANGVVRALKWLQTAGPGDLLKAVPESYLLGDRALYLASFNKMREAIALDGLIPDDGARTALRALASFDAGIHPEKIALAKTFTNEFSRRAKEKFRA